jgi:lipopolysaccharide heptosyltransferase II
MVILSPIARQMKIIVLTREHIGDLVCTTPALRSLRRRYPDARITVEVGERAACVLENNPHVDEILVRRDHQGLAGKLRFIALLRHRKYDLGVILDNSADMISYLWAGGVPLRVGLVRKRRFSGLLTDSVLFDPTVHEMVDNFRNVVGLLGADVSDASTEVFPGAKDSVAAARHLVAAGLNGDEILVGLNPGASLPSNRWLPERFAELGDRLTTRPGVTVLLLGGREDASLSDEISAKMHAPAVRLTGRLTVMQLAEVLARCAVLVTADTGPMHLAVAMKTPVVALFGPAALHESGPGYAPGHRVIRKVAGCPDCTKQVCRHDRRCMRAISAEEVAREVFEMLPSWRPFMETVMTFGRERGG